MFKIIEIKFSSYNIKRPTNELVFPEILNCKEKLKLRPKSTNYIKIESEIIRLITDDENSHISNDIKNNQLISSNKKKYELNENRKFEFKFKKLNNRIDQEKLSNHFNQVKNKINEKFYSK